MCRKNHMQGWCLMMLGLGLILGQCSESWVLCCGGGCCLIAAGLCVLGRK